MRTDTRTVSSQRALATQHSTQFKARLTCTDTRTSRGVLPAGAGLARSQHSTHSLLACDISALYPPRQLQNVGYTTRDAEGDRDCARTVAAKPSSRELPARTRFGSRRAAAARSTSFSAAKDKIFGPRFWRKTAKTQDRAARGYIVSSYFV